MASPDEKAEVETPRPVASPPPRKIPTALEAEQIELFQTVPVPGLYLQMAAIDRAGGTAMTRAYRERGFPALMTPSSSPTLFRVIIGPLTNSDAVAEVKMRLRKIGVDGAIMRKY